MHPMGIPFRSLKAAMLCRARVMTGFCPVSWASSSAAESRILMFWIASPRPMLMTIFLTLGDLHGALVLKLLSEFRSYFFLILFSQTCHELPPIPTNFATRVNP